MANPQKQSGSGRSSTIALIVLVVVFLGVAFYWFWLREPDTETPTDSAVDLPAPSVQRPEETKPEPEPEPEPEPQPEAAPEPEPEPLPALGESDEAVLEHAEALSPDGRLVKLLVPEGVLLKFVRAVIALEEGNLVKDHRPLENPDSSFKVLPLDEPTDPEVGQRYRIDPANYERYTPYVEVLAAVDKQRVAELYHRYYPLLDEAYQQYGVDRGGFLNITLGAIDRLLDAPIIEKDLILVQSKVFYEFQDPELEDLPASDKLLIRIGPDNARQLKQSLRELRDALNAAQ